MCGGKLSYGSVIENLKQYFFKHKGLIVFVLVKWAKILFIYLSFNAIN